MQRKVLSNFSEKPIKTFWWRLTILIIMNEKVITLNELQEGQTVTFSDRNMYSKTVVSAYAGMTGKIDYINTRSNLFSINTGTAILNIPLLKNKPVYLIIDLVVFKVVQKHEPKNIFKIIADLFG